MKIRLILYIFFLILNIQYCYSQPAWLEKVIDSNNYILTHDKSSAIKLYEDIKIDIDDDKTAKMKIQIVYKILNSDGKQFGTISLPISPYIEVTEIDGWLYTNEKEYKSLKDENIIEIGIFESAAYYDESRVMFASFPELEPGMIVAFEAEIEESEWTCLYQTFIIQEQEPVVYSKHSITIPENWELVKSEWHTENIEFEKNQNTYTWLAHNLPYQKEETLQPSWYYLSKRVFINCYNPKKLGSNQFRDWSNIGNWCYNLYDNAAQSNDEIQKQTKDVIADAITNWEKVEKIANFIQSDIRYVAVEINKERWQPRTAIQTLNNYFGDCKDKTTLMRAMLNSIDIESIPVLANTKYSVDNSIPTPFQFDHCIIGININTLEIPQNHKKSIIDNWLIFDPTDTYTNIGYIPWFLQGDYIVLGGHLDSVIFKINKPKPDQNKLIYNLNGQIKEDGSYAAEILIVNFGRSASEIKYDIETLQRKDLIKKWREKLSTQLAQFSIEKFETSTNDSSATIKLKITGNNIITNSGKYKILRPDIFQNMEYVSFEIEDRKQPIWFGAPRLIEKELNWQVPNSWKSEINSDSLKYSCESASIKCVSLFSNNQLKFNSKYVQFDKILPLSQSEIVKKFISIVNACYGFSFLFYI